MLTRIAIAALLFITFPAFAVFSDDEAITQLGMLKTMTESIKNKIGNEDFCLLLDNVHELQAKILNLDKQLSPSFYQKYRANIPHALKFMGGLVLLSQRITEGDRSWDTLSYAYEVCDDIMAGLRFYIIY